MYSLGRRPVFGSVKPDYETLDQVKKKSEVYSWTINKSAKPGDDVLFYIKSPFSAIVAHGIVLTDPSKEYAVAEGWPNHYMSDVTKISMLSQPIERKDLLLKMPAWGWLKMPRRSTTVPDKLVGKLESFINEFIESPRLAEYRKRVIPARVKLVAWVRDKGQCAMCGSTQELQFDHIIPFSKGGTSKTADNIQLLTVS